jgi:hypothetical protein
LLCQYIELSGLSRREVEKRLLAAGCGTDLGRLLTGRLDLKLRHIIDICGVIELYPREFFASAFKGQGETSPLMRRLEALTRFSRLAPEARSAGALPAAADLEGMNRRLAEILERLDRLMPAGGVAPPDGGALGDAMRRAGRCRARPRVQVAEKEERPA